MSDKTPELGTLQGNINGEDFFGRNEENAKLLCGILTDFCCLITTGITRGVMPPRITVIFRWYTKVPRTEQSVEICPINIQICLYDRQAYEKVCRVREWECCSFSDDKLPEQQKTLSKLKEDYQTCLFGSHIPVYLYGFTAYDDDWLDEGCFETSWMVSQGLEISRTAAEDELETLLRLGRETCSKLGISELVSFEIL